MIQEVVPAVLSFFSTVVSVPPTPSPVLLDRSCSGGGYYVPEGGSTVRRCVDQCVSTTCGGIVTIPDNHLKRCVQCDNTSPQSLQCSPGVPSTDGAGVADTDYILYISALPCVEGPTLAFAAACQMESQLDRPIAGYINFCPNNLGETTRDYLFQVAKHELFHALGFSYSLMALWRDSSGDRRTPSDQQIPNTVTTVNYATWDTFSGPKEHTVTVLRTEAVLREGRAHFGCSDLEGVELENQGGNGTALQHWEKRVLGNEAMTGIFDYNPVFSRLSLAVLEDSGWYTVDYTAAKDLPWGRGRGCDFVRRGCGDMLDEKPYCGMDIGDKTFGCTLDRGSVAICSLGTLDEDVPADFRYLPDDVGGSLEIADYCPYFRGITRQSGRTGNCTNSMNQPDDSTNPGEDVFGETYGGDSVCLEQGRGWQKITDNSGRKSTLSVGTYGGGCYETECSADDGLTVYVRGAPFQCECEGQELVVDVTICQTTYRGSIVCPSCSSVCDANLCPSTEPPSCPGNVKEFEPVTVATDCTTTVATTTAGSTGQGVLPILSILLLGLVGVIMK